MGSVRESGWEDNAVNVFLAKVRGEPVGNASLRGRLIFALDATASRQETWDSAVELQAGMFRAVAKLGALDVQLVYYRGDECKASKWTTEAGRLGKLMRGISCEAGRTQIGKVLAHVRHEARIAKVHACVFVGDAQEEDHGELCDAASDLKVPMFVFQEGEDRRVKQTFQEIARLTSGAYCSFDEGSAAQLSELLKAVAVFATGGVAALADLRGNSSSAKLLKQLRG